MNNKIIQLVVALVASYGAYGQVGIGTSNPNNSAQLEIAAKDRGILIPNVSLNSATDVVTITNGNINSLLVFNTSTGVDIKPGYYYWFDNRWNRIIVSSDLTSSQANVIYNPVNKEFTYVDNQGNIQIINFEEAVKNNETITTLIDNKDGTVTYTNEAGVPVIVNMGQGPAGPPGADGAPGIVGVESQPGKTGTPGMPGSGNPGAPGAGVTIVTNEDGTWVYNPTTNAWTNINGATGPQGQPGEVGVQGIPGTTGTPGIPGSGTLGAPGEGITIVTNDSGTWVFNSEMNTWTNINGAQGPIGSQGPSGPAGLNGTNGLDGKGVNSTVDNGNGTFTITYTDGTTFTSSDLTGPAGAIGATGPAGVNGLDGKGITSTVDNGNGTFTIVYTDGTTFTTSDLTGPAGAIGATGPAGVNGLDGKGVNSTVDNGNGTFTITYTDGTTFTSSDLTGPAGAIGATGPAGVNGLDGKGINSTVDNGNGTFTITYTDGTTFTTSDLTGPAGAIGATGPAGATGLDGKGITSTVDNGNGTFTITYTDGSTFTTSDFTGPAGVNGLDGKGITSTVDNGNGTFTITYTDETTFTTSDFTGPQGVAGTNGAAGPQGPAGNDGQGGVTKAGTGITVTGDGTLALPYIISSTFVNTDDQQIEVFDFNATTNELKLDLENGGTKMVDLSSLAVKASNGTNIDSTTGNVKLGGTLTEASTIGTSVTKTLALTGLQTGTVGDNLVVADANGVLKTLKAAMPRFFYMPSIIVPTSQELLDAPGSGKVTGDSFNDATFQGTINLYGRYTAQFGTPMVSNPSATTTLPILPAAGLDYLITWYDTNVFTSVTVNNSGVMTYTVKASADITVGSFMNIILSVK